MEIPKLVKNYQCPGCINGDDCYSPYGNSISCSNHSPATYVGSIGKVALGLPKGFNRIPKQPVEVHFIKKEEPSFEFDELNIPIWVTMDNNNLIVKTYLPRLNKTLIVIQEEGDINQIKSKYPFINFTDPESKKRIDCDL